MRPGADLDPIVRVRVRVELTLNKRLTVFY